MKIEKFTSLDLENIKHLQPDGWSDIYPEFVSYINFDFCLPVKIMKDDRIIALGASIIFEKTAWLAHIIVDEEFRNQGLGFQVVDFLLKDLQRKQIETVLLIATELGQPVYYKAGFLDSGNYIYTKRDKEWNPKDACLNIFPLTKNDYKELLFLDQFISGENRKNLIDLFLNDGVIYLDKNKIQGYYLPQLGEGLIFASKPEAGIALMDYKYATRDKAVIPEDNVIALDYLLKNGFAVTDTVGKRMYLGKPVNWRPKCYYSRISGNYG